MERVLLAHRPLADWARTHGTLADRAGTHRAVGLDIRLVLRGTGRRALAYRT